jgi:hypothetical protein
MSQPIIKRDRVRVNARDRQKGTTRVCLIKTGEPTPHGQKAVRLLEEGGRTHAIEFTCSCGEVTAVELTYPGETPAE